VVESVKAILREATDCHGEDSLAEASVVTWAEDVLCDRADQSEAILGVTKQDDARDEGETLIAALSIARTGGIELEQITLSFTHRVVFSVFDECGFLPVQRGRSRDGLLVFPKIGK